MAICRSSSGPTAGGFCFSVHHDNAEREWAYDRHSHAGRLDKDKVSALQKRANELDATMAKSPLLQTETQAKMKRLVMPSGAARRGI